MDLTNLLPAKSGGFRRRWGVRTMYAETSGAFGGVRMWAYNVAQDASNPTNTTTADLVVLSDTQNWKVLQVTNSFAATPLTNTLVFAPWTSGNTPSSFAHSGNVGAVVSRSWFYYCNGIDVAQKVQMNWTTFNTDWNWGIVAPLAYTGSDSTTATSTITAFGGTGMNYSSPTVTITGGGGTGATCTANLMNGSITSFSMTDPGSGYTSTPSVEITDSTGTGAFAVAVYNDNQVIVAVLPSGPMILNEGRTYTYAWSNQNVTGHTSDIASGIQLGDTTESYTGNAASVLGPAVGIIGNVPAGVGFTQIYITINPVTPIDIQIDTCVLLATSDGGSLDQLYQVALIPINASTVTTITFTDTLPDTYSDASTTTNSAQISTSGVFARFFDGPGTGFFTATTLTGVLFTQSFNSLMFNPHPTQPADGTVILDNYIPASGPLDNGNQQQPFQNAALTGFGTFANNIACQGNGISVGINGTSHYTFQMVLTGNFIVTSAGDITFTPYIDAAFMIGLGPSGTDTPTRVSGPTSYNGYSSTPFESYALLAGLQDISDWHTAITTPFVINFPAAGVYPYEICYATLNHTEREMCLMTGTTSPAVIPPGSPNGATYTGLTLLNANLWVDTDSYGNLFGIINNDPPPATLLYPTLHQGRMFGTDGKSLFFSKSLSEVTTSTGLITSKWEEAWPGTNSIPIGLDNELIIGMRSNGQSLHIATEKSIYELQGTDPSNFSIPSSLFQETGIMSNDLWTVVYSQGQPAGYCWITPDLKMIYSDFNTYNDVSMPVYSYLSQWTNAFTTQAKLTSFTYGPYNFVVLCFERVSGGSAEFLIFETVMEKWYRWTVTAANSGPLVSFVYEQPETGYRGLFYQETNSSGNLIKLFDPANTTDDSNVINWSAQTSWTSLSDPLAFKTLNEIEVISDESSIHVECYGASTQAQFDQATSPTSGTYLGFRSVVVSPLGTSKTYWAGVPTNARYYSFKFYSFLSGTSSDLPVEVLSHFIVEHFPMVRF